MAALATFQGLNRHVWLETNLLDGTDQKILIITVSTLEQCFSKEPYSSNTKRDA